MKQFTIDYFKNKQKKTRIETRKKNEIEQTIEQWKRKPTNYVDLSTLFIIFSFNVNSNLILNTNPAG